MSGWRCRQGPGALRGTLPRGHNPGRSRGTSRDRRCASSPSSSLLSACSFPSPWSRGTARAASWPRPPSPAGVASRSSLPGRCCCSACSAWRGTSSCPRPVRRRSWVPIWGRMVRDASANCLPFSQVGGFVFGARAVTLHGMSSPVATASTVVDLTAEFLAELAFVGIGLGILLARAPASEMAVPVEIGLGLAVVALLAFVWLQQGAVALFGRLGRRIASRWFANARDRMELVQAECQPDLRPHAAPDRGLRHPLAGLAGHRHRRLDRLPYDRRADRVRRCPGHRGPAGRRRRRQLPGAGQAGLQEPAMPASA